MSPSYVLLVHGGAGRIEALTPEQEQLRRRALRQALEAGRDILAQGGSSVDAVIAAVRVLEDCGLFNAGRGAVRTKQASANWMLPSWRDARGVPERSQPSVACATPWTPRGQLPNTAPMCCW
jgi:hypothetical protein